MNKISCILPTFNEKDNVLGLIKDIHQLVKDYSHEIIIVDDNSPDGTAQAVRGLNDLCVKVIVRTENFGYARAIRCGIENATGDIVVIMDSDFNHLPQYILVMIPFLAEYDCISASRFVNGGQMFPWWRSLCSWLFNGFIRIVTGGAIKDNLFGFFVIKRDVLLLCPWDDIFWGFGDYGIRLLYYLQKSHFRILEIPAVYGQRKHGCANKKLISTFYHYFCETLKLAAKGRIICCIKK